MAIQRNAIVSPFSVKTPFMEKGKENQSEVGFPHVKWLQSVANGVNNSAQLTTILPANSAAKGVPGTIAVDANWLYYCYAPNQWRRIAGAAF